MAAGSKGLTSNVRDMVSMLTAPPIELKEEEKGCYIVIHVKLITATVFPNLALLYLVG